MLSASQLFPTSRILLQAVKPLIAAFMVTVSLSFCHCGTGTAVAMVFSAERNQNRELVHGGGGLYLESFGGNLQPRLQLSFSCWYLA